jgi:hypothetical protein
MRTTTCKCGKIINAAQFPFNGNMYYAQLEHITVDHGQLHGNETDEYFGDEAIAWGEVK